MRESFLATPARHPWIIHLAEGTSATARDEFAQLAGLGCLAGNTVVVHGVGLSPQDIEQLIACRAALVWCPSSNIEMLGETLNPRVLADRGRLALGTDSRITGSHDLLEELRVAATHSDLTSRELLRIVTADAASIMRLAQCGHLDPGAFADCVVLRADGDPFDTLLRASRSDIRAVVHEGLIAVGDTDFAAWFAAANREAQAIVLDGAAKLLAAELVCDAALALESGVGTQRSTACAS